MTERKHEENTSMDQSATLLTSKLTSFVMISLSLGTFWEEDCLGSADFLPCFMSWSLWSGALDKAEVEVYRLFWGVIWVEDRDDLFPSGFFEVGSFFVSVGSTLGSTVLV